MNESPGKKNNSWQVYMPLKEINQAFSDLEYEGVSSWCYG